MAEVLITLGIIGVVAAMTIPSLIANHREKETVSRLKKAYSTLSQAYILIVQEHGNPEEWEVSNYGALRASTRLSMFTPYLKMAKDCGLSSGCGINGNYIYLNKTQMGAEDISHKSDMARIRLADGVLVTMHPHVSEDCTFIFGIGALERSCAMIYVDTNGSNKPNQIGVDTFKFFLTKTGIVPSGIQGQIHNSFENSCKDAKNAQGLGCTAWVIFNENMDYLHCDDLSWNGKTSCK